MTKEQDALDAVMQRFAELKQAHADAYYWSEQYKSKVLATVQQQAAQAEKQYQEGVEQALAKFTSIHESSRTTVAQAGESLGLVAAPWTSPIWKPKQGAAFPFAMSAPGGVYIGEMHQADLQKPIKNIPALAPLIGQGHIFILSRGAAKDQALTLLQSLVTRISLTFPVLSARFVFIDPLGLGDNFPFKRLPESIRGNTVYSEPDEIRAQMRDLTEHIRRVTLKYLARDYDNIEAYNQDVEAIVEPYRFLCIADFPSKFDTDTATRLLSLAGKGVRTGVYIIMHINLDATMPRDFDLEELIRTGINIQLEAGNGTFTLGNERVAFVPERVPDSALFNSLLSYVSEEAEHGAFQGIPFHKIAVPREQWWKGDTSSLIEVPIGRTGARDNLNFWLGRRKDGRISSHALVGGKTGSGKSTLFHVLINSLVTRYSPEELELYLVDFKEGVEFKTYADHRLPHARVIAIESEREFGLSVLRNLQAELERRGALFKGANAQDLTQYRERTKLKLSRIVLIVDEFQVLFAEQDTLANKAALILEDLSRRGRAFGIHIVLGSQSVKVANLPASTYGQFATRIVLQSSEQEVAALLSPDNVAVAELLERPGEVIYNDDGGKRDRNTPGQVAILQEQVIAEVLFQVNETAHNTNGFTSKPQTIFRGQQPASLEDNTHLQSLYKLPGWLTPREMKEKLGLRDWVAAEMPALIFLGEAIEIKPHTTAAFRRRSRSNLLVVGDDEQSVFGMIGGALLSLPLFYPLDALCFRIIDLSLKEEAWSDICQTFQQTFSFYDILVRERRGASAIIDDLGAVIEQRQEQYKRGEDHLGPSVYFILAGAHRLPDLRPVPGRFGRNEPSEQSAKLNDILLRGPELGVHTLLWYDSAKSFDNALGRPALAYFDQRVVMQMNKDDSQFLIGDPAAARLQPYRALLLDEDQNSTFEKFKPYSMPRSAEEREQLFRSFADQLRARSGKG